MYDFCFKRGLREVWGYFWTSWYAPQRWKLWARSSAPFVSRLRTTMNVENFWRQLKHNFLHNHVRPRLDLLVWILVTKVTPAYMARAHALEDNYRIGRGRPLTPFRKAFKTAWRALAKLPLSDDADKKYITCVATWTCTCPGFKYHACLLCKHLVQAVGEVPPIFFIQVVRRRTLPFYRHRALTGVDASSDSGSITDGDDNTWSGNPATLRGGGGWRDFDFSSTVSLGKRGRLERAESDDESVEEEEVRRGFSPDSNDSEAGYAFMSDERHRNSEQILRRADELERAAAMFRAQVEAESHLWISSAVRRDVGKDVSLMVADVKRHESSGLTRKTTWGKRGSKEDQRRAANTMGYQ
ncbi:hypothetical protein C8R46DRAFT_1262353, partial [Mycena filopes]